MLNGRRGLVGLVVVGAALVGASAPAPAVAATSNTWTVTGDNVAAPGYQRAVRLSNGRVLALGGQGVLAELYDPATGTWSRAASMNRSRTWPTATVLTDGRVLVAGGASPDASTVEASAEIYDPAANRWTLTGSMTVGRLAHTATLLRSGKVLVAGGEARVLTPYGYYELIGTATAELYDPATGRWQATGSMSEARYWFTATLLADGTVLAASAGPTDVYDPRTGAWTPTAPLPRDIDSIAAVRLRDGRVLSIGGVRGSTTAAEIYDPASRTWQTAASLNYDRYYNPFPAVLLADGRVLVAGGVSSYDYGARAAEIWDPAVGFWTLTPLMFNARQNPAAVLLADGRVLVEGSAEADVYCDNEGGGCEFGPTHSTELYTP
jgi:Kelch motif